MIYPYSNYPIRIRGTPRDLTDPTHLDRPTSTDFALRVARRVASSRPESLRVARPRRLSRLQTARIARPWHFERQNLSEKCARERPRRDFRGFRVAFRVDFRGFSRLRCASDSTRSAKGRTPVFADRHSISGRFSILLKNRRSTKIFEKSLRRACATQAHAKNSNFSLPAANRRRN